MPGFPEVHDCLDKGKFVEIIEVISSTSYPHITILPSTEYKIYSVFNFQTFMP